MPTSESNSKAQAWRRCFGATALVRAFHAPTAPLINTGALARWKEAHRTGEPRKLSGFVHSRGKPLKRLMRRLTSQHRAKAPVLMSSGSTGYEIRGLGLRGS